VRIEFHQKDTCAIWVVTVKDRHDKWHVYEVGAVGGSGSSSMAGVRAKVCADKAVGDVRQAFKEIPDNTTRTRIFGNACWWWNDINNRITLKGIVLLWESTMTRAEFYDYAHVVLELGDDDAPTD
jgi:hypothetical protein